MSDPQIEKYRLTAEERQAIEDKQAKCEASDDKWLKSIDDEPLPDNFSELSGSVQFALLFKKILCGKWAFYFWLAMTILTLWGKFARGQSYDSYDYDYRTYRSRPAYRAYPVPLVGSSPLHVSYYRSNSFNNWRHYVPKVPAHYRLNPWRRSNIPGVRPHEAEKLQDFIDREFGPAEPIDPMRPVFRPNPVLRFECRDCP